MRTRTLRSVVYLAGGIGLILSVFAALEVYDASLSGLCSINSYVSCGAVLTSGHTTFVGLPDFAWGIGGFVAILAAAGLAEQSPRDPRRSYALLGITSAGVALALYLLTVEVGVIHALCPVCAGAYGMGAVTWIGAIELARRGWRRTHEDRTEAADPEGGP